MMKIRITDNPDSSIKIINEALQKRIINRIERYRIGIATARARPYYMFTSWLRHMDMRFDVLAPSEIPRYGGHIILTTRAEAPLPCRKAVLYEDELERGSAVALAALIRRCGCLDDELVVGVDPGKRLGLSVFYAGEEVERSLFSSVDGLASHVCRVLERTGAARRVVRIGNGEMATARRLVAAISAAGPPPFRLEFVNEVGTSPRTRHCNRRGERDMLAARAIAQMEGRHPGRGLPVAAVG